MTNNSKDNNTVYERNKREGWGCSCHGMTFCPDSKFSHYENDQPVFVHKSTRTRTAQEDSNG